MSTRRTVPAIAFRDENLKTTPILDFETPVVREAIAGLAGPPSPSLDWLRLAHAGIARTIRPVYSLNERQPVSKTLRKKEGSCSQRFACLEAYARAVGVPTRNRALWIAGRFWRPRFPWAAVFIPKRILLAWPQFWVEDRWVGAEELFGPLEVLGAGTSGAFTNSAETLFEAVSTTAVDFDGRLGDCDGVCVNRDADLSRYVVDESGVFDSRDQLFDECGVLSDTLRGRIFELIYGGRSCVE